MHKGDYAHIYMPSTSTCIPPAFIKTAVSRSVYSVMYAQLVTSCLVEMVLVSREMDHESLPYVIGYNWVTSPETSREVSLGLSDNTHMFPAVCTRMQT